MKNATSIILRNRTLRNIKHQKGIESVLMNGSEGPSIHDTAVEMYEASVCSVTVTNRETHSLSKCSRKTKGFSPRWDICTACPAPEA